MSALRKKSVFDFDLTERTCFFDVEKCCALTVQDSASEKAKKFNDDWLSLLGMQKGLTGLAKDRLRRRMAGNQVLQ